MSIFNCGSLFQKSDREKPKCMVEENPTKSDNVEDTSTVSVESTEEISTDSKSVKTSLSTSESSKESTKPSEPRTVVKVCKMGSEHMRKNVNNHDFVFSFLNLKAVTDGCGSGKHSEVGTRLFGQLFAREIKQHVSDEKISEDAFLKTVNAVFEKMLSLCNDTNFIFENYCFTILVCLEFESEFVVYSCGDGYIIKESSNGISFERLDDGTFPAYYVYNWVDASALEEYKEGVAFKVSRFSKTEYSNVGVASDGLRFFDDLYEPEKTKFFDLLVKGKGGKIDMLINRNNNKRSGLFHDDISICF